MSFEVRIEAARHDVANDGHPPNGSIGFKVRLHVEAALRACRGLDLDARRHAGTHPCSDSGGIDEETRT